MLTLPDQSNIASYTPGYVHEDVIIVNVITSWLEMGPHMTYMYQYIAPWLLI